MTFTSECQKLATAYMQARFNELLAQYGALTKQRDDLDARIEECRKQMDLVDKAVPLATEAARRVVESIPDAPSPTPQP